MKIEKQCLQVITLDGHSCPSPWSDHKRAKVSAVTATEAIELISRMNAPFLLDLTRSGPFFAEETFRRKGTILADPWERGVDPAWFTYQNLSEIRVTAYTPVVYCPALLEMRRLLRANELGDLAGIEISASNTFRAVDLLYATAHLFGPPLGYKAGNRERAKQDFEFFSWYTNFGCSAKLDSSVPSGQLEIKAACRLGVLRSVPDDTFVRVYPAGKEAYGVPLPDGDGIYYNILDVIDTILPSSIGAAFSARETANAIHWVRECVYERPSLLL